MTLITIDANVFCFYICRCDGKSHNLDHSVEKGDLFCRLVDYYPIAINEFIEDEYQRVVGYERARYWMQERYKNSKAFYVEPIDLPNYITCHIRDNYKIVLSPRDKKYLETCLNTKTKCFVTENKRHFLKKHKKQRRKSMDQYIDEQLQIQIFMIDPFCDVYNN